MPSATDFKQERAELEAILAAGAFNRAPGLAQLLAYICNKYFESHRTADIGIGTIEWRT